MSGPRANEYAWETGRITNVVVATDAADVLAANTTRRYAGIVNDHASQGVYLALGVDAVVGKGIYLAPNGGSFELNANNMFHGRVSAIGSGAGTLSIQEGT